MKLSRKRQINGPNLQGKERCLFKVGITPYILWYLTVFIFRDISKSGTPGF